MWVESNSDFYHYMYDKQTARVKELEQEIEKLQEIIKELRNEKKTNEEGSSIYEQGN